jgi:uncharacterized integral membrane protein (TIGR00697 family)
MLLEEARPQYKYYTTLALFHLTIMVAATSVAYKPVKIFIFTATASSLLFALTFSVNSIIAEIYGKKKSKELINQIIPCGLLFSFIVSFIPYLPSPENWHHESDFLYVFGHSARFAIFGTIGSYISYRVNTYLISRWKKLTSGSFFPLRIVGANTFGEFFLVLITSFGAFYGVYPTSDVVSMFLFAYFSKIIYAIILSWPAAFIAIMIKRKEGVDVYD